MYYSLDTDGQENTYMGLEEGQNSHVSLMRGRLLDISAHEIELPYRYTMTVDQEEETRLYDWYPGAYLMTQRLVNALQGAGVDNLQLFPCEIKREDNGEEVTGYTTVNVIGRLACAVSDASTSMPIGNSNYYTNLAIDPSKAKGQLMFRLKESPLLVLLHESVVRAIEPQQFTGLTLKPIAEVST
jgi:hypothetical protein